MQGKFLISDDGDVAYLVIYSDYPAFVLKKGVQKILDDARDGALESGRGILTKERKISINGFPGREFEANIRGEGDEKLYLKMRLYFVNLRLYQQIYVAPKDGGSKEDVNMFLDSFKIQARK